MKLENDLTVAVFAMAVYLIIILILEIKLRKK